MEAGKLQHRVTIKSLVTATTGTRGQRVVSENEIATVWASVAPLSGTKLEIARQLVPTATHQIEIRFRADVTVRCKVVFGSPTGTKTFNVGHLATPDEVTERMVLTCTEEIPPEGT
jgi:SPP1 family predicted phage head-tail adaptor